VEVPMRSESRSAARPSHIRVCSKYRNANDETTPWRWETIVPVGSNCLEKLSDSGSASQEVELPVINMCHPLSAFFQV
jgi:hypothetical protein